MSCIGGIVAERMARMFLPHVALVLLTDAQKKSFEEMKGEKFEFPRRRGRRPSN